MLMQALPWHRQRLWASSFAAARQASRGCRVNVTAAEAKGSSNDQLHELAAELGIEEKALRRAVPNYCSGCGIKLQQADPDVPG